jgi:signal transduction histidine kinase
MGLLSRRSLRDTPRSLAARLPRPLAIALDLAPDDPDYGGVIRGAQIQAIVRLTPVAMIASCINAAIILATWASIGQLRVWHWVWASAIFLSAASYARNWMRSRANWNGRSASRRALRKTVINGGMFGALWGVVPAVVFPGAPLQVQLLIGCLTAGMMCAGGFVLATVPLAGMAYVVLVAAGALYALMQDGSPVYIGLTALLVVYTAVVIVNINWSAALFVSSRLAEAQVRTEVEARERAQAQAAHAERMTALGELAGGIAHDFNNVLQAVDGGVALIDRHLDEADYVRRQIGRIRDAVQRGGAISRRLLAFARRDVLRAEIIDAADLLAAVGELLEHTIGPSIAIRVYVASPSPRFLADRSQLDTVILNLAANARDAMPGGGRLTLAAETDVVVDKRQALALKAGRYVVISVSDSGSGMDPATLARAADPFFTTKPKGKGTGLGLSMAKGFAEQSGGGFEITSAPGRGSTVRLWLPLEEAAAATPEAVPGTYAEPARTSGHRVLVVDDDELVRDMLMASLQDAGFAVVGAESGERALAELDRDAGIDALVTDLSMPGMSGWDLLRAVEARRPSLPAIMLTGHVGDVGADAAHPPPDRFLLLQKPVPPTQLAGRLTALISQHAA